MSNYNDGANTGTLRAYRADVNNYFPLSSGPNPVRTASGNFTVSLPDGGPTQQIPEGASLVVIYRVMSPNFPLSLVVLYNGLVTPTATTGQIPQAVQGFYDAVGGASGTGEVTDIYAGSGGWNNISNSQTLGQSDQYIETLNTGSAYAAVVLSTPVNNSDHDGILDVWKGEPGLHRREHRIVCALAGRHTRREGPLCSIDYMCSALLTDGTCDTASRTCTPRRMPRATIRWRWSHRHSSIAGVHLPSQTRETPFSKARSRVRTTDRSFASSPAPHRPRSRALSPGMAVSNSRKVWPANFSACASNPSTAELHTAFPVWSEGQLSLRSVRLLSCDTGLE